METEIGMMELQPSDAKDRCQGPLGRNQEGSSPEASRGSGRHSELPCPRSHSNERQTQDLNPGSRAPMPLPPRQGPVN